MRTKIISYSLCFLQTSDGSPHSSKCPPGKQQKWLESQTCHHQSDRLDKEERERERGKKSPLDAAITWHQDTSAVSRTPTLSDERRAARNRQSMQICITNQLSMRPNCFIISPKLGTSLEIVLSYRVEF